MPESEPLPFLVGGDWRSSGEVREVRSPFDGSLAGSHFVPSERDLEDAADAATAAFAAGPLPRYERAEWLTRAAGLVAERAEDLARTVVDESAKPLKGARAEVSRFASTLRWSAEEARRHEGELLALDTVESYGARAGLVSSFPAGPVLGITPFNYPLNLVAHKVGPALAVGCPIVVKPASSTPLSALALGRVLVDAGVAPGQLSVLPVPAAAISRYVGDSRFAHISFTGSPEIGWDLKRQAPKARVTLELGGNAAVVVCPDADLDLAAERIAWGAFNQAGQSCISAQRLYAHEDVWDPLLERLVAHTERLVVGDPGDERTDIGPLIDVGATDRVEAWVDEALAGGARALIGAKRDDPHYLPTILTDVQRTMNVSCEEVFGPVLVAEPFREFSAVLAAVNDSRFGLQASVFTQRVDEVFTAFRELHVGGVVVNDVASWRADEMPYGGVKDSGSGREGVRYAMREMCEPRLLVLNGVSW